MSSHCCFCLFSLLVSALLAGCGPGDTDVLYPVSGRVFRNHQPLNAGSGYVVFHPDAEKDNRTTDVPSGTIDDAGHYVLFTRQRSGAPSGWYRVVVTATGPPTAPGANGSTHRPVARSLIPPEYADRSTTPLSVEVTSAASDGDFDFDVVDSQEAAEPQ